MKRKAQVKMMETIAVIFIFFILVLFGLIFYTQISKTNAEAKTTELAGEQAISLSVRTLFLPELRCGRGDASAINECIDAYKIQIAKDKILEEQEYYFDILGYADIFLVEIYPGDNHCPEDNSDDDELPGCTLYSRPKPNFGSKASTPIPVTIFNPLNNKLQPEYTFGVLYVEIYT
jgi:hypothetical protein